MHMERPTRAVRGRRRTHKGGHSKGQQHNGQRVRQPALADLPVSSIATTFSSVSCASTSGEVIPGAARCLLPCSFELWAIGDTMTKTTTVGATFDSADFLHDVVVAAGDRVDLLQERWHVLSGLDEQSLEIQENCFLLVLVDEGSSDTSSTTSTCSTNSVNIIFDFLWHVEVDDVLDGREIETFGGDIGTDQDVFCAFLEGLDRLVTFLLIEATMDCHYLYTLQQQILVNIIDIALVLAKDEHRRGGLLQTS
mmetsp:Transcript_26536/g.40315  ORF Transcript_26536/g.40315 Transcript_26536/m.40315 type:complete len:252 (+) Transcript_26536:98-853(+)